MRLQQYCTQYSSREAGKQRQAVVRGPFGHALVAGPLGPWPRMARAVRAGPGWAQGGRESWRERYRESFPFREGRKEERASKRQREGDRKQAAERQRERKQESLLIAVAVISRSCCRQWHTRCLRLCGLGWLGRRSELLGSRHNMP